MVRLLTLIVWGFSFGGCGEVRASGWVKGSGEHYVKLSYTSAVRSYEPDGGFEFSQKQQTFSLYGAAGLDWSWPAQIILNTSHKTVKRTADDGADSHTSAGFADTDMILRHRLGAVDLGSGFNLLVAADTGIVIPTTKKKFRSGEEEKREDEVPDGRETLITSLDRGKGAFIYGVGMSVYRGLFWMNLGHNIRSQANAQYSAHQSLASLGVGLPMNSWLELKFSQNRSSGSTDSVGYTHGSVEYQYALGGGFTFWEGLALELEYRQEALSDKNWKTQPALGIGFSHRTL